MKSHNQKFGIWNLVFICFLVLGIWNLSNAQSSPQFLVSWRALNYVPADFSGKIFPSEGTEIEAGFDLIVNGKIANLSRSQILWNVNGETILVSVGAKTVRFVSDGTDQKVRITVEYNGQEIDKNFTIPSVNPEITIDSRYPIKTIPLGQYIFTALPYFFNVDSKDELSFNWNVNGQTTGGSPDRPDGLILDLSSQGQAARVNLNVTASVQNIFDPLEVVSETVNYFIR